VPRRLPCTFAAQALGQDAAPATIAAVQGKARAARVRARRFTRCFNAGADAATALAHNQISAQSNQATRSLTSRPYPCLWRAPQAVAVEGKFTYARWVNGTWDMTQFAGKDGATNWDLVIDAEVRVPC
jgi:hypothetical protein